MKKTKIVTSMGPSSTNIETFTKMVECGANVARINFSHATIEERENVVKVVKEVRKITGQAIGILYDTKGPEFRNGVVQDTGIKLIPGKKIEIVKEEVIGTEERFSVNHPSAIESLNVGNIILLENGLMSIQVISKKESGVVCKVINGGTLFSKKSLSVPGIKLNIPFVSEVDREDIIYACEHEADFLALSFVESKENVFEVREILKEHNRPDLKIISKIESQTGINNLDEIVDASDGIMVARGDLGVEVPMFDLPIIQKKMALLARFKNKICIVATEMLESMKNNSRPTRAEVTDIATAVFNGTDAVMLSGETTVGKYPIEAVKYMKEVCSHTESSIPYNNIFAPKVVDTSIDAIVKSVAEAANSLNTKLIVVPTLSGFSAKKISNLEPKCPILALVSDEQIANQLTLNYGVFSKVINHYNSIDEMFEYCLEEAKKFIKLETGDNIIITGGFKKGNNESTVIPTNLMKIETI